MARGMPELREFDVRLEADVSDLGDLHAALRLAHLNKLFIVLGGGTLPTKVLATTPVKPAMDRLALVDFQIARVDTAAIPLLRHLPLIGVMQSHFGQMSISALLEFAQHRPIALQQHRGSTDPQCIVYRVLTVDEGYFTHHAKLPSHDLSRDVGGELRTAYHSAVQRAASVESTAANGRFESLFGEDLSIPLPLSFSPDPSVTSAPCVGVYRKRIYYAPAGPLLDDINKTFEEMKTRVPKEL